MRTIKKYANRRLYDTEASTYINLEGLADLVRAGEDVRVVDVKTGEDLTREVLLQVVLEVLDGVDFLPVGMLRRIIRATGKDAASRALRTQLATGLTLVSDQLDRMEDLLTPFTGATPFNEWAEKAGEAATRAADPEPEPEPDEGGESSTGDAELDALRARLDQLEARLKRK